KYRLARRNASRSSIVGVAHPSVLGDWPIYGAGPTQSAMTLRWGSVNMIPWGGIVFFSTTRVRMTSRRATHAPYVERSIPAEPPGAWHGVQEPMYRGCTVVSHFSRSAESPVSAAWRDRVPLSSIQTSPDGEPRIVASAGTFAPDVI